MTALVYGGIFVVTAPGRRDPSVPSVDDVRRIADGLVAGGLERAAVWEYLVTAGQRLDRDDHRRHQAVVEAAMTWTP